MGRALRLLFWLTLLCTQLSAQNAYIGTDFWLGFTPNNGASGTTVLYVTSAAASSATISIPNASPAWSSTIAIAANAIVQVTIPGTTGGVTPADAAGSDLVAGRGIHVVSNNPVSVYATTVGSFSAEAYIGIPTAYLGTNYITISPEGSTTAPGNFLVVATQNATTVTMKLPAGKAALGHAAGSTWSVTLNAGQTYQGEAAAVAGLAGDITGTEITSDKPVAVFSGAECMQFPGSASKAGYANCGACDIGIEQLTPSVTWGKNYIASEFLSPSLATRTNSSYIRVVTSDPGTTTFNISGYPVQTLTGKGNYMDYKVTGGIVISSDKPIGAYAIMSGNGCYSLATGNGDASIIALVPQEQWGKNSPFVCPTGFSSVINVLTKKAAPTLTLDGAAVTGFTAIGTTGFYRKSISVAAGNHLMSSPADSFMVYVYGESLAISYGYSAAGPTLLPIALPVNLLFFTSSVKNKSISLKWATAQEQNSAYYVIEKSKDGINFNTLSRNIQAAGTSGSIKEYEYIDQASSSVSYYRLKQVDIDGKFTYSSVITGALDVVLSSKTASFSPDGTLQINLNSSGTNSFKIDVYSSLGQLLKSADYTIEFGDNAIEIKDLNADHGIYTLVLTDKYGISETIRVVK